MTLDELTSIEFRCKNKECGASLLLSNQMNVRFFHTECPHCRTPWFERDASVEKALVSLRNAITTLGDRGGELGCAIRLEVKQFSKRGDEGEGAGAR